MAVTVENQLFTKERVRIGTSAFTGILSPLSKAFFMVMGQFANMKQLATYIISNLTADVVVEDEACTLYAVWLKKQATATDAFFKIFNDAANDATDTDARLGIPLLVSGEEHFWCAPNGVPMAAGIVAGSYTAFTGSNGTTPSTSGDCPNGVIVYGA